MTLARAGAAPGLVRSAALLAGIAGSLLVRVLVAGTAGVTSWPAVDVFVPLLLLLVVAERWRPPRLSLGSLVIGVGGGIALLAAALLLRQPGMHMWLAPRGSTAIPWALLITAVSIAEELVFRGVLFDALDEAWGAAVAAVIAALAFAAMHVPLYGWRALPLDVAAGMWLSGLRLLSGDVTAPAAAHAVADVGVLFVL